MGTAQEHIAAYCPTCQDTGKKQPKARCDLPVGGLSLVRSSAGRQKQMAPALGAELGPVVVCCARGYQHNKNLTP
jgi:hypothetical protein